MRETRSDSHNGAGLILHLIGLLDRFRRPASLSHKTNQRAEFAVDRTDLRGHAGAFARVDSGQ